MQGGQCADGKSRFRIESDNGFVMTRRVRVKDSGLEGLEGLVQNVSSERVVVLPAFLGRRQSITVE